MDPRSEERCDAIVLDSLTDAQRILRHHYTMRQGESAGREKTTVESWGIIIDKTAGTARFLRDVPLHVVLICLDHEENHEDLGLIHRPGVNGKRLPNDLAQYVNAVGYVHVTEQNGGLRHQVMFRGIDRYLTKGLTGLDDHEPPEPLYWIHRALGGDLPDEVRARVEAWHAMASERDDD